MNFLGSLDVLSIGFGNENDLHGLMKLSALSPFGQLGAAGCIMWLFRGVVWTCPTFSSFIMIDELGRGCWGNALHPVRVFQTS